MKTFKFLLLFLGCVLLWPACNNDDDANPNNMGSDDCMVTYTVDGTAYTVEPASSCVYLDNTLNIGQTGTDPVQLQVNNLTAPGTFDLSAQGNVLVITLPDGTQIGSVNGQIVVTEISDNKAKGTFSGEFFALMDISQTEAYSVTGGSFTANF